MTEVGTVGEENKKYSLQEWNVYRGKGSDRYFLKNRYLRTLYDEKRKFNKTYY